MKANKKFNIYDKIHYNNINKYPHILNWTSLIIIVGDKTCLKEQVPGPLTYLLVGLI